MCRLISRLIVLAILTPHNFHGIHGFGPVYEESQLRGMPKDLPPGIVSIDQSFSIYHPLPSFLRVSNTLLAVLL